MSSTSPDTETSCRKKIVIFVLFFPGILLGSIFLYLCLCVVPPYFYFRWLMERDLNKMYLAEGIRLSGSVLERATSTSSGTHGNYTAYYVKVLYEAPDGGIYVKNFKVTEDKESLENIQLIILPHYPASAIQYSTIDPLEKWMPDKWFTIDTDQFMKLFLSFVTVFGFNICVPWNM